MRLAILPGVVLGIFSLVLAAAPAEAAARAAAPVNTHSAPVVAAPAAPAVVSGSAGHNAPVGNARRRAPSKSADPMLAAFLGVIPLSSGFYLTSAPQKGLAFTLADAVLIGSIWNIRRDDKIPDGDVQPYFFLLGAVNLADAALSLWQARSDEAARITVSLNPSGEPVIGLAWHF